MHSWGSYKCCKQSEGTKPCHKTGFNSKGVCFLAHFEFPFISFGLKILMPDVGNAGADIPGIPKSNVAYPGIDSVKYFFVRESRDKLVICSIGFTQGNEDENPRSKHTRSFINHILSSSVVTKTREET